MNDNQTSKNFTSGRKKLDPSLKRTLRKEITLNSIEIVKCAKLMSIYNLHTFRDLFDKLLNDAVESNLDKILLVSTLLQEGTNNA